MKKLITKILIIAITTSFIVACSNDNDNLTYVNPKAKITLSSSETSVILLKDSIGKTALTLTWEKPDYGFKSEKPTYKIYLDKEEGDFSEGLLASTTKELNKTFEVEELNKLLANLKLAPEKAIPLKVMVIAEIGQYQTKSNPISLNITTYATTLDLTTTWGVVGSGYNNWGEFSDAPFYKTNEKGILVAYVNLKDGEIKFRENNDWANAYGDANKDGILDTDADNNIKVTAGTYKITINLNNLNYTIEPYSWGVVGTNNNWGETPDAVFLYDPTTDTFKTSLKLVDGEMKFRLNNDWAKNFGDANKDGILDTDADNNIKVTAGYYNITLNLKENTYTIKEANVYGIVGSGYNNWGQTPDFYFVQLTETTFVAEAVTLVDGEIKFRVNESWDINYGDANKDGILDTDADNNIKVTAGKYRITLNFTNTNAPTYTMLKL